MGRRNRIEYHGRPLKEQQLYAAAPMGLARDSTLRAGPRSVAFWLWSHADGFEVSAALIAQELRIGAETAGAALDKLEDRGWLIRQPIVTSPGREPWSWRFHLQRERPFTDEERAVLRNEIVRGAGKSEGSSETGTENPEGTGTENPEGTGTENPEGTGTENPEGTGTENPEGTGTENPDPKKYISRSTSLEVQSPLPPTGGAPAARVDRSTTSAPAARQDETGSESLARLGGRSFEEPSAMQGSAPPAAAPLRMAGNGWALSDGRIKFEAAPDDEVRVALKRLGCRYVAADKSWTVGDSAAVVNYLTVREFDRAADAVDVLAVGRITGERWREPIENIDQDPRDRFDRNREDQVRWIDEQREAVIGPAPDVRADVVNIETKKTVREPAPGGKLYGDDWTGSNAARIAAVNAGVDYLDALAAFRAEHADETDRAMGFERAFTAAVQSGALSAPTLAAVA